MVYSVLANTACIPKASFGHLLAAITKFPSITKSMDDACEGPVFNPTHIDWGGGRTYTYIQEASEWSLYIYKCIHIELILDNPQPSFFRCPVMWRELYMGGYSYICVYFIQITTKFGNMLPNVWKVGKCLSLQLSPSLCIFAEHTGGLNDWMELPCATQCVYVGGKCNCTGCLHSQLPCTAAMNRTYVCTRCIYQGGGGGGCVSNSVDSF